MSKLVEAKVFQVRSETFRKNCGFVMRWAIIWLVIGGVINVDTIKEIVKWINL